jgi:quinolinate synthase
MKAITLGNIRRALETMQHQIMIDESVAVRARLAVERMLEVK